ncbi:hypothetical protein JRQ81_000244 [Phrynocephalus forsythii]|uniref:Reverse transcriptase RNase H-like domain-containing protein n=1 Tax=Phrynocephalus forsythii TaxID=171643 RepID=A0A9Q1B7W2_9SAUR|nr:hypothetical protein JRQ81_000244 [Phrynocephalus forsythii]
MGQLFCLPRPTVDASLEGWEAVCRHLNINDSWSAGEKLLHINQLKLLAVFRVFKAFLCLLSGNVVQVVTDNMTTTYHINEQGSIHSQHLLLFAVEFWEWCMQHHIFPIVKMSLSLENVIADHLSRTSSTSHEWELHQDAFQMVLRRW